VIRLGVIVLLLAFAHTGFAYPEFQKFSQENSGRRVDCAMCHIAATGPSGTGLGQISGLSASEKELLSAAREAKQPGQNVKSPILNSFGNEMVRSLGGEKIAEITTEPAKLAALLGYKSDLDEDGIADAQEYLDGTDPTNNQSGKPSALFVHNLRSNVVGLAVGVIAVCSILYGIGCLLRAYTLRRSPL
jgi:hypothetical protein